MSKCVRRTATRRELLAIIERLEKRIAELEMEVARLRNNSSTSSKPPSSDIVKPPKPPKAEGANRRSHGGQAGHPRHERPAFSPDEVDEVREYTLDACPDCGSPLKPSAEPPRIMQQAELPPRLVSVTEHRALPSWCPRCGKVCYATLQKLVQDALAFPISTGYLAKLVQKTGAALNEAYEQLLARVPNEAVLNIDETGHKENGKHMWTWCFRAKNFTLFRIEPSRGSEVLLQTLGTDFDGLLGCDYFSAYRKFMGQSNAVVQFCLAHLIRDVRFLTESSDKVTSNYGRRVLDALRRLFRVIHRRDQMAPVRFQRSSQVRSWSITGDR